MHPLLAFQDIFGLLLLFDHQSGELGVGVGAVGDQLSHLFKMFLDLVLKGLGVLGFLELLDLLVDFGVDLCGGGSTCSIFCSIDIGVVGICSMFIIR